MKTSRTVRPPAGVESQTTRRLPLVELLIDTEAGLFDLAVRSALQVLDAMLEEDRTAICATPTRPTGIIGVDLDPRRSEPAKIAVANRQK